MNVASKFALSVLIASCAAGVAVAEPSQFVESNDQVDGKSLDEYANAWWQWASSMPKSKSPVVDTTGTLCHINQSGPVWFLAGGYGTSKISRTCTVPSDKYIFFPVINMVYYPSGTNGLPCEQAKAAAAINNDALRAFVVNVDGEKAVNPATFRHASPACFDLFGAIPKQYNAPRVYPAASDGYWVMLKPLSKGTHHISFRAEYGNATSPYGLMVQDIEYTLDVVEP